MARWSLGKIAGSLPGPTFPDRSLLVVGRPAYNIRPTVRQKSALRSMALSFCITNQVLEMYYNFLQGDVIQKSGSLATRVNVLQKGIRNCITLIRINVLQITIANVIQFRYRNLYYILI